MLRIASQYTFCSPQKILKRMVVEQDEKNVVKRLFSLDDSSVESSQTLFFDGVISMGFVSLKQNLPSLNIALLLDVYNYIDLTTVSTSKAIIPNEKPLLLDFYSNNPDDINQLLPQLTTLLAHFSLFEIIAASTYYPLYFMKQPAILDVNHIGKLLLWEGVDLHNKKITENTRVRQF
jgi:hypothetical protein